MVVMVVVLVRAALYALYLILAIRPCLREELRDTLMYPRYVAFAVFRVRCTFFEFVWDCGVEGRSDMVNHV